MNIENIEKALNEDLALLSNWFNQNQLIVNLKPGKTEVLLFGTSKRLSMLKEENQHRLQQSNC